MKSEDAGNYTLKVTSTLGDEKKEVTSSVCKLEAKEIKVTLVSDKYIIGKTIISKIGPKTTVANFKENVETEHEIAFKSVEGNILTDTDIVTTGTTIIVGETLEYKLCVMGDLDKDGEITSNDLALTKLQLINKENPEEIIVKATDVDMDNEVTINDLARLKLVLINKLYLQ